LVVRGQQAKLLDSKHATGGQVVLTHLPTDQGVSAMILTPALPLGKAFFTRLGASAFQALFLTRFLLAALLDGPRLSAAAVAAAVRTNPCHRGNVCRFLRHLPSSLVDDWLEAVYGNLLLDEPPQGTWIFILDQTYCGHNSARMENGYTTSPRGKRSRNAQRKDKRKKRKKQPQSYCHCFVFGLLLTPNGLRLPVWRPYYTQEYCAQRGWPYRKQTELAAALIERLRVPARARVVVLGDTAFDAEAVLAACGRRGFRWVVAMNGDRVLAGAKPRPKVTALATAWAAQDYALMRLTPGEGRYEAQRRAAACRVGLRRKSRQFWVHAEQLEVHQVGTVRVLYSTMQEPAAGRAVGVQKVLMTNDLGRGVSELVELYDLRWQIELFFKECKGTLGLDRYRFQDFDCVEGWVGLCVLSFAYLEWYRAQMLRESWRNPAEQKRWRWQRSHGLCQAVRQDVEEADLHALAEQLQTPAGVEELRQRLRRAVPKEYRKAA
jgi:hypothetical protein